MRANRCRQLDDKLSLFNSIVQRNKYINLCDDFSKKTEKTHEVLCGFKIAQKQDDGYLYSNSVFS